MAHLDFDVHLRYLEPSVWRRFLLLEDNATFADLHEAIQDAFGWKRSHLWEFRTLGRSSTVIASMPRRFAFIPERESDPLADEVLLRDTFQRAGTRCLYIYDFGDGWEHEITFRGKVSGEEGWKRRLLGGEHPGPPEDCGGPPGYEHCLAVARGEIDDPDMEEWLEGWRPIFDLERARLTFDLAAPRKKRSKSRKKTAGRKRTKKKTAKTWVPRNPAPPPTPQELRRRLIEEGHVSISSNSDEILDAAFAELPGAEENLSAWMASTHVASGRKALAERIARGVIPNHMHSLAIAIFAALKGIGRQTSRLRRVLKDEGLTVSQRALAAKALLTFAGDTLPADAISEEMHQALFIAGIREMALIAMSDGGAVFAEKFSTFEPPELNELLARMRPVLQTLRVPALVMYRAALTHPGLAAARSEMLRAVSMERTPMTDAWLKSVGIAVEEPEEDDWEDEEDLLSLPPVSAIVSSCDGQGAFNLLLQLQEGENPLAIGVCIRAAEGLRDALVMIAPGDLEDTRDRLSFAAGSVWAEVSMGEAASLVAEAFHRSGVPMDDELFAVTCTILTLDAPETPLVPEPQPDALTSSACRAFLQRKEVKDTWFFDGGDFDTHMVSLPPQEDAELQSWIAQAGERLSSPHLRARLYGMFRHNARVYTLMEDEAAATLCETAAARVASDGLAGHPLIEAMLENTAALFRRHASSPLDDLPPEIRVLFSGAGLSSSFKPRQGADTYSQLIEAWVAQRLPSTPVEQLQQSVDALEPFELIYGDDFQNAASLAQAMEEWTFTGSPKDLNAAMDILHDLLEMWQGVEKRR